MKIALAQMEVTERVRANLAKMADTLRAARAAGAELVVFPETALTGYLGITRERLDTLDPYEVHVALQELQLLCAQHELAAAVGQYFKRCGRWYNNAILIDARGALVTSYDKCHLVDRDCYEVEPGAAPAEVVALGETPVSLGVCHDIRYPEHVRSCAVRGSLVHLHLFYGVRNPRDLRDQEVYDAHLTTRAAENSLYVLACNASHEEQMLRSQVRCPEGRLLAKAESWREQIVYCEIDPRRAGAGWPLKRRADLYETNAQAGQQLSYFERAVWEKKPYMIDHDRRLLEKHE